MKESSFDLCKFGTIISINMNHRIFSWKTSYDFCDVMIHVIKHDMDPNSNVNYRKKFGPTGTYV